MSTIAEGVEHPIEATMLRHRGCAAFQGFLVSRPLPADEVLGFLASWRTVAADDLDDAEAMLERELALPSLEFVERGLNTAGLRELRAQSSEQRAR